MIEVRSYTTNKFNVELQVEHKQFGHWKTKVDVFTASVSCSDDEIGKTTTSVKIESEGNGRDVLYALLGVVSEKRDFYGRAANAIMEFLDRYKNDPNSLPIIQI